MLRLVRLLTTAVAIQCMLGAALLMVLMDKPMRGGSFSTAVPASYAEMIERDAVGTAISVSGISAAILIATMAGIAYAVAWYWRRRSQLLRDGPPAGPTAAHHAR